MRKASLSENTTAAVRVPGNVRGLSAKEAEKLLLRHGPNEIARSKRLSAVVDFLLRFKNPLIFILIFAASVSAFLGDWKDPVIIVVIVVLSVALDFFNTYKSEKAAEILKEKVRITAAVLRGGNLLEIPTSRIVPGDAVRLSPGDLVPADGEVVEAADFFVNESSLTGESFPVEKPAGSAVYMGASVVTGAGWMTVVATGRGTKFSRIAETLAEKEAPTEFDRGIKDFSLLIMKITLGLVVFVFFANMMGSRPFLESFLFAVALAVGLTPELLPMIIALNLTKGSLAMAKRGVIVKKLSAIQNFGSMDVLCTDKTGTLTEDKITVIKCVDGLGKEAEDVSLYSYISSCFGSGFRNPLDAAVKEFRKFDIAEYKKIDEVPFDYVRKRNSVVAELGGRRILIAKGAPEELLGVSAFYRDGHARLTEETLAKLYATYRDLSADGFRVLGVAVKSVETKNGVYGKEEEREMTFLGFVAFLDPPKKTAQETVKKLGEYGIEVKILTGDNRFVAEKITREIKLPVKGVLAGPEIETMSDDALRVRAETTTIFSRVSPDEKRRIIRLIQKSGHVVGYLGDGINDAPSLKAADVGISVDNAVDVAKESADFILTHKSLKELAGGVIEGRKTFSNTLKYLMMALSSNFGNMFSMAAVSLFLPFLPMLTTQILLNNLLYDSSQFAIPLDNVDPDQLKKPRKLSVGFIRRFMVVFGPVSSLFDLVTFAVLFFAFRLAASAFQTGWFLESVATQTLVIYVLRSRLPFSRSRPAGTLVLSTFAAVAIGWTLPFVKLGGVFRFVPPAPATVLSLCAIVASYLIAVKIAERWFYKKFQGEYV